jgi:hypothetical protein
MILEHQHGFNSGFPTEGGPLTVRVDARGCRDRPFCQWPQLIAAHVYSASELQST